MKFLWIVVAVVSLWLASASPAEADESVLYCSPGAGVATTNTSCPFASWMHDTYFGSGRYYSPVTGNLVPMSCSTGWQITLNQWPWYQDSAIRCSGGNNAVVWLW